MPIELLGIDNVLFDVKDLDAAVAFYTGCGFRLRWRSDEKAIALFSIGREAPGLLVRRRVSPHGTGCLWVEVADASEAASVLETAGIQTVRIETTTGLTCEACDPSGNRIGFADYTRNRGLARHR